MTSEEMEEVYLAAKIFIRSYQDALFCVKHSLYKHSTFENFMKQAGPIKEARQKGEMITDIDSG